MINISKNKCIGCGICVSLCPEEVEIIDGQVKLKGEKEKCLKKILNACPQQAIKEIDRKLVFALGTDDKKNIKDNDHVGEAKYFQIWNYSKGELVYKEERKNAKYQEDEEKIYGDPGKAQAVSNILGNVDVVVGKMFGPNIVRMKNRYVCVAVREGEISKVIKIIKENINEIVEEYEKKDRNGLILN